MLYRSKAQIKEIAASRFVRNFGRYQDEAIKEPVIVKSHDRVIGVFVSPEDYARLKRGSRRAHRVAELPQEYHAAFEATTYPTEEEIKAARL